MFTLELKEKQIIVKKVEEVIYSFNWEQLNRYWTYASLEDVENISADYDGEYLIVIITTAQGQGGIVAIVDTKTDAIKHIHDGAYAIKAIIIGRKVITLYFVMHYGKKSYYYLDSSPVENMQMNGGFGKIKLPENIEFSNDKISLKYANDKLNIEDADIVYDIDISSMFLEEQI